MANMETEPSSCPACGAPLPEERILLGIPEPGEPPDTVGGWVTVLHTDNENEAHLASGFLQAQGMQAMVYPEGRSTGFEPFGRPGLANLGSPDPEQSALLRVLVDPADAAEALAALRDLRDHPETLATAAEPGRAPEGGGGEPEAE